MIQKLARSAHIPSLSLIPLVILLGLPTTASGQTPSNQEVKVRNADWNVVGEEIVITYDLVGPAQGDYDVNVTFLNETEKGFRMRLTTATGDIGKVSGPAAGKTIKWNYKKAVPAHLGGQGYYFGFDVDFKSKPQLKAGEESSVFSVLGLVALLGAVIGLVLLISSGGSD